MKYAWCIFQTLSTKRSAIAEKFFCSEQTHSRKANIIWMSSLSTPNLFANTNILMPPILPTTWIAKIFYGKLLFQLNLKSDSPNNEQHLLVCDSCQTKFKIQVFPVRWKNYVCAWNGNSRWHVMVGSRQSDGEMLTSVFFVCARQAFVLAQQRYNEKCQRVVLCNWWVYVSLKSKCRVLSQTILQEWLGRRCDRDNDEFWLELKQTVGYLSPDTKYIFLYHYFYM